MDERYYKLKDFFEQYSEEYLKDGTKKQIIDGLDDGDSKLFSDLLEALSPEWMAQVMKKGKFRAYSDLVLVTSSQSKKLKHYKIGYMDDFETGESDIPVLKHIIPRIIELSDVSAER